jgi:hypothetical protein
MWQGIHPTHQIYKSPGRANDANGVVTLSPVVSKQGATALAIIIIASQKLSWQVSYNR